VRTLLKTFDWIYETPESKASQQASLTSPPKKKSELTDTDR